MSKINSIIFSNDRPAQLNLLLESVLKNAVDIFDINVIINQSNDEFKKSYDNIISKEKFSRVNFTYKNDDLKTQVLNIISEGKDYFSFFLDDNIIYRQINFEDIINQIDSDDDVACFSLRLGKNVKKCYTLGGVENLMHDIQEVGGFLKWDWTLHYLDFGYPLSTEGHVFRKKDILKLVKKSKFSNNEELEMSLFDFSEIFPRKKMVSYSESSLVGVPIARVQESLDNEMVMALKESKARVVRLEMNNKFLSGNFINLENIDFSDINGCHQEIDLGVDLKKENKYG